MRARLFVLVITACACAVDDAGGDGDGSSDDGFPPAAPTEVPPTDPDDLLPWLRGGGYLEWTAESAIHPSSGPHFGDVLTYVNASLLESLGTGATEHPIGAATVKELYGDDDVVVGWSAMVKVAGGTGGASWFWYERYRDSVYAAETDVQLCWGCHEDGVDQILTPFPLQ